jgi:aspartate carbamoyltransferase regulatory subunit
MLEIQKYLTNGGTLRELRQKYSIRYVPCAPLNLISLNCQLMSPKDIQMVNECRSLFLNPDDWTIAFKGMNNFFDINSPEGQETNKLFDWNSARAYEKLDGAMICIYFYNDTWRIGSRFSPDGGWLAFGVGSQESNLSWKELTIKTIEEMGISIDDFYESLDKNIFYSYEICTQDNQVGVIYKDNFIKLIAAVDKDTLQELDIEIIESLTPKASFHIVKSNEEVNGLMHDAEAHEIEGFVVCDKNFNRMKIYNPNYLKAMNSFKFGNPIEALANLVSIFETNVSYYAVEVGPQSIDGAVNVSDDNMLSRLINLGDWMTTVSENNSTDLFSFWPEAFSRINSGESFVDIIQYYDNDYLLAKINQFENSYLN